jgi:ubiquinol-cytochrome c reductase cytochrome b subunit
VSITRDQPVPTSRGDIASGRATTRFTAFGAVVALLAAVAVLTGLALLPFYHAGAREAYQSVQSIEASVPLRILRAAHHWASALLILLGGIWLLFGLLVSAYRRPLRLAWVGAVGMVLLFLLFQITGHLLPWDTHGVCTAAIETGVAENMPVIGPLQARMLRGGDTVGSQTLSLWYVAHIAVLPAALLGLSGLFVFTLRRVGIQLAVPRTPVPMVLGFLLLMAFAASAPLGAPTSPVDLRCFTAQPEWYVLPLHSLLTLAQSIRPGLAFVGTMVLPGLVVLALLTLPWLDRRTVEEPPSHMVRAMAGVGVVGVLILARMQAGNVEPLFGPREGPGAHTIMPKSSASHAPLDPALMRKGRTVFENSGCLGCHVVNGKGGSVGPVLDGEGARHPDIDWQIRHLRTPSVVTRGSTMPSFRDMSEADQRALATYLLSLK